MKKNNFFKLTFIAALLYAGIDAQAQVKVGDNPTSINASSVLEMESANKGMLLPRIALASTTTPTLVGGAHVAGMTVYNTATAGDVTPGYYYNDGAKWVRLMNAADATALEPWFNVATGAGATANTQDIYQMGRVGIGIVAPKASLDVIQTNDNYSMDNAYVPAIRTGYVGGYFKMDIGTLNQGSSSLTGGYIQARNMNNSPSTGLTIALNPLGGNVGIGTTTPSQKLTVANGSIQAIDNNTNDIMGLFSTMYGDFLHIGAWNRPGSVSKNIALNLLGGNVGIGTSNPVGRLSIHHSGTIASPSIRFTTTSNIGFVNFRDSDALIGNETNHPIHFQTNSLNRMIITETGNVGIGTVVPGEKLHVIGNILASGTITPDYVFEEYVNGTSTLKPEYKRMSLQEVDTFVKENKHLPGVPSAKEVEAQGGVLVNRAAEINLEKIEELYLHVIEQQKQIEALKAELKELKK